MNRKSVFSVMVLCLMSCAMAAPGMRRVAVEKVASAYLAPINQHMFKLVWPGGAVTELARDYSSDGALKGRDGWRGRFTREGDAEIVNPNGSAVYRFRKGRIVELRDGAVSHRFPYDQPRIAPHETRSPLAVSKAKLKAAAVEYAMDRFRHKWDGTGRLAFPFVNPNMNGALYAQMFVVFLFLAAAFRRRWLRIALGTACAMSAACLIWTMSRGAWFGTALALAPVAAFRLRRLLRLKWLWIGAGGFFAMLFLWIAVNGTDGLTRGFESGGWSNALRIAIWRAAPRMMCDAPDGWAFCGTGAAYVSWYQPLNVFALMPTLINDHLTYLVGHGWIGRVIYLFAAFVLFMFSGYVAVRRRYFPALAFWTVLAVPACFNPMMHVVWFWLIPAAASIPALGLLPWRNWRMMGTMVVSALALALGAVACIWLFGRGGGPGEERIRADGSRVLVHGDRPTIWLVDDGTIGGGMTGRDIRLFYSAERRAPALGYVTRLDDLPEKGVTKLILSGDKGTEWLKRYLESLDMQRHLPNMIVFVSPPFSPSAVPAELHGKCCVRLVIGEFSARYEPEYRNPPTWVKIMPGMERYLVRWMWTVMNCA